jgi:serine/threonine protein kinase
MALEIVQILASGTFGHVAVVRDPRTTKLFAAKVLRGEHLQNEKIVARMLDEAQLLDRLSHPNIVRLEELRDVAGRPVLLLEWIRGVGLDGLVVRMPQGLPVADACEIALRATNALDAAWRSPDPHSGRPMRVIHRDIKPSNILLSVDGEVKVLDFGIAQGDFEGRQSETVSVVLGAHGYLAPERLDGAYDTPRGDVYAMGCVFYELLTGHRLRLSLHPKAHEERIERGLMQIRPPGLSPRVASQLSDLVRAMCSYYVEDRLDPVEVSGVLQPLMTGARLEPDLPRLAVRHVLPMLESRTLEPPTRHSAWSDLAFLEERTGSTPQGAPQRESDQHLANFLQQPGWPGRVGDLKRRMAGDPSFTAAPLLDALTRLESRSFWKRLVGPDSEEREQIAALLDLLRSRPDDPVVLARIRPYARHRDPELALLARQILEGR